MEQGTRVQWTDEHGTKRKGTVVGIHTVYESHYGHILIDADSRNALGPTRVIIAPDKLEVCHG